MFFLPKPSSGWPKIRGCVPGKKKKKKTKTKPAPGEDLSKDLWISPRFSLRGQHGDGGWDQRQPGSARFLELADIALGIRKPEPRKKTSGRDSTHVTDKPEPYSR